jgi:hypothetical protein
MVLPIGSHADFGAASFFGAEYSKGKLVSVLF